MKKHLPNIITLFNLLSGLIALLFVFQQKWEFVFGFVLLGIAFDFIDGLTARYLKVSSEMGLQLDSLADMITSGIVPSFTMFFLIKNSLNLKGDVIFSSDLIDLLPLFGFAVALGSAWRLAKFNIDERQTSSFIGLPTPANTLFIVSLPIIFYHYNYDFTPYIYRPGILIFLSLLSAYALNMEVPLFSLKFKNFAWKNNLEKYLLIIVSLLLLIGLQIAAIPVIILVYIILSLAFKK